MSTAVDAIERLGTEQIRCDSECQEVECLRQKDGYYPRAFFLDPESKASEVEVSIVGKNPGKSKSRERQFYKIMAEQHEDRRATMHQVAFRRANRLQGAETQVLHRRGTLCHRRTTATILRALQKTDNRSVP
jgi:hypothetical protein